MKRNIATYSSVLLLSALLPLAAVGNQDDGKPQELPTIQRDVRALALQPHKIQEESKVQTVRSAPPVRVRRAIAWIEASAVWRESDDDAFYYKAKMAIDADGSPDAYHPSDSKGRDALEHAGSPGNWWALATDNGNADGTPLLQGEGDPNPGYYISTTSLEDETRAATDPHRYVDATAIPFIVLPEPLMQAGRARLGDFAVVVNTHNRKRAFAIFADIGPDELLGEGSVALAKALGIPPDARAGGVDDGVVFLVFPRSGNGKPRTGREIEAETSRRFQRWGGMNRLDQLTF